MSGAFMGSQPQVPKAKRRIAYPAIASRLVAAIPAPHILSGPVMNGRTRLEHQPRSSTRSADLAHRIASAHILAQAAAS